MTIMTPNQPPLIAFTIIIASLLLAFNGATVNAGFAKCRLANGPIPYALRCDNYPNLGTAKDLDNQATDKLNTAVNKETPELTTARLSSGATTSTTSSNSRIFSSLFDRNASIFNIFNVNSDDEFYNPALDAYCFNEDYPVPSMTTMDKQTALYLDYKTVFDTAFDTTDVLVSHDRIPGMFLRLCFHDNTINIEDTKMDFRTYVSNSIDPNTKKWTAESRYMITSGADASNLICPEERTHPNNDLDQSATKVLTRLQGSTLKAKHPEISYADLLHNGCNAAAIYLTGTDPATALTTNPFTFGRKDACHVDVKCGKKYALCGPSEILPSVDFSITEATDWFTLRGMNVCSMMSLLWTHTTIEDMDLECPLQRLICTPSQADVDAFGDVNRYFNAGDVLDYFDFFLNRGTHEAGGGGADTEVDRGSCDWTVDGNLTAWPMTQIDCTFGLANVENVTGSTSELTNVMKNFGHNSTYYNRFDLLQCALNQLSGTGIGSIDNTNNACAQVLPPECKSEEKHMFGSFFSTLNKQRNKIQRTTVDPSCERFGYRRHRSLHLASTNDHPTEYIKNMYTDCLNVMYDMYLVIDGVHFVMLSTPLIVDTQNKDNGTFCPPVMIHSAYDSDDTSEHQSLIMEKVMEVLPSEIENMNDEMKFHLGLRPLEHILETYNTVNVGYQNNSEGHGAIYHPITNNCVAFLQNMAYSLNLPTLRANVPLQEFITNRLLLSLNTDDALANDMFQRMIQEYDMEQDDDGPLHRLLSLPLSSATSTSRTNDLISKIMEYYMS